MPTYDYHCTHCHHAFEESQKITAEPLKICPQCHRETLRRGPGGGIGLSFKGTGFYITDYGSKGGTDSKEKDQGKGNHSCGNCNCE